MGDYFSHWLSMTARADESKLPRIFGVNWFRKDADGKFLWPGFGDNSRVLDWICRRLEDDAGGQETPIGTVPRSDDLHLEGLSDDDRAKVDAALAVDPGEWKRELPTMHEHFDNFGDKLPPELREQLTALEERLG